MSTKVKDAVEFATKAHRGQTYGSKPYIYHLAKVFDNVKRFGGNESQQIAAWLHDVIEDTPLTKMDISKAFGPDVAHIVDLVSNKGSVKDTYKRINRNRDAVFVKLCDRLANVTEGAKNDKYRQLQPVFKSVLYRKGEFENLWNAIDRKLGL